jgi:hypothetical protein
MSSIWWQPAVDADGRDLQHIVDIVKLMPDGCKQRQTSEQLFHGGESGSIPLGSASHFNGLTRLKL